ncbi:MAG TPA: TonB family protein, partial [Polyangiaceae bacterium]|nr:TonB family protein [Polyangiaceae bacterium]
ALSLLVGSVAEAQSGGPGAQPAMSNAPKLTKAPKLVKFVEAPYPDREKAAGRTAAVVVQIAIAATGSVDQVVVKESAGAAFDAAAVAAIKQFVFDPAEIDGKPAPIRILYRYEFVLRQEKPTFAILSGVVRDRKKKKPLAGVKVGLDTGESAVTNLLGKFSFNELTPGKRTVTLSAENLTEQRTEETLEEGKELDATYDVEPEEPGSEADKDDLEIVIIAPALQKQVVSTEVSADQGRKVPGTQGDVLKVVESMPGVARSSVGSGALVVWGAAPEDTRVYVDGVRIPLLYHNGGVRSVIHSDLVQSVELAPGGYGAPYGRGLGGLVKVQQMPVEKEGLHGSAAADLLDASASVRVRAGEKWGVALAARKSYLDSVLSQVTSEDIGDFFPIPRYHDGQARVFYEPSTKESLELGGLLSSDDIDRTVENADPARSKRESRRVSFYRLYARYKKQLDDGGTVNVVPSFGVDRTHTVSRFGLVPTELESDSNVFGLRAYWRSRVAPFLTTTLGVDTELVATEARRVGSITSPPREGDVRVFGQAPSGQVGGDTWQTVGGSVAPFAEADLALADDRLHIVPGARVDPYFTSASRRTPVAGDTPSIGYADLDTVVEPRIAVNYAVSRRVLTKAAWGRYHQSAQPEDLSAVFGNPTLPVATASHWLVGGSFKLTDTLSIEATAFYSRSSELAVRSPLTAPLLAEALVPNGAGRAYGTQYLLRQELTKGFFGWISYSILRSERTPSAGGAYRLFDYDQTHVLTALASYDLGRGFEIGARVRYASGFPRTPVARAYFDSGTDSYQPVFGEVNARRIPAFIQADVRLVKKFTWGASALEAYLDVQNVTARTNPEEIVYSPDYRKKRYVTGLSLLPVVGLKWTW